MVVKKCQYLPRHVWRWRWTNVNTSPAIFGGGGGQMSLPPPPNLAEEVDKCHLPPPPELWDQRTLKVISRPASARAAGKNERNNEGVGRLALAPIFSLRCKLLSWVAPNIRGYESLFHAKIKPENSNSVNMSDIFPSYRSERRFLECAFIRQTHKRPSHEDEEGGKLLKGG